MIFIILGETVDLEPAALGVKHSCRLEPLEAPEDQVFSITRRLEEWVPQE